ncbi:uncharacterized protein LOC108678461 [Hyalella azteca]|uniref:Uncharacterized protein LOC108678461 n=1 Tax=Hyalella azteca TaxID=294128 RepID=A0A8B7P991_HYAAZ|nr:uncharacterized protein LOC108678461 [Hyalella azteca]
MHKASFKQVSPGFTVSGNGSTYRLNRIRCSSFCRHDILCYVFTWDTTTEECRILTSLDPTKPRVPAPTTLETYYLTSDPQGYNPGLLTFIGLHIDRWTGIRQLCKNRGGDLASPVNTQFAYMLYVVTNATDIAVGVTRNTTTQVLYDINNHEYNVSSWDEGEPDVPGQGNIFLRRGKFWDINNANRTYHEVPCRLP